MNDDWEVYSSFPHKLFHLLTKGTEYFSSSLKSNSCTKMCPVHSIFQVLGGLFECIDSVIFISENFISKFSWVMVVNTSYVSLLGFFFFKDSNYMYHGTFLACFPIQPLPLWLLILISFSSLFFPSKSLIKFSFELIFPRGTFV